MKYGQKKPTVQAHKSPIVQNLKGKSAIKDVAGSQKRDLSSNKVYAEYFMQLKDQQ